jgi:predicted PurR-regulated permease PerM
VTGKFLLLGAIGVLLYFAHSAFVPIALALLFALVLSGPVERLHKYRVPRNVSAALILALVLASLALVANLMWAPAQQWYAAAPQTMKAVKQKIMPVARAMGRLDSLRQTASNIAATTTPSAAGTRPSVTDAAQESGPVVILSATREFAVSILTFVIVTLFLLAGGPPMLARLTAAFVDDLNAAHALKIIEKVRREVGRFYVTTALINLGLGCATAAVMLAWGMPTPLLWGVVAATLNFIPYVGSATTLILVTLVAFVSYDTLGPVLGVAGSYIGLATLEGQVVQPLLVGRRLDLNPLLVFLALWFGGFFWGIAGIILAMPALLTLKVVAESNKHAALKNFLGPQRETKLQ